MKNLVKNSKPLILAINCNKTSGGGKVMLSLAKAARDNGFHVITAAPEERNLKLRIILLLLNGGKKPSTGD